tara:strand:+ start:447 stop:1292 length:846 start_codon:yes stop_codon:yes gene_type:complete
MAFSSGEVLTAANLNDLNITSITTTGASTFKADQDITDFTDDTRGIVTLYNSDGAVDDFTCLDFDGNSTDPAARIGMKYTGGGSELHFGTSNAYTDGITNDAMIIGPTGNVAIGGTTNPGTDARFLINDASNGGSVYVSSSSASAVLQKGYSDNGGSQTLQFVIRGDGDFESRSNSYGAISDERAKTNIADANSHTEDLKKLRVVNYQLSHQWDEEKEEFKELEELGERHIGLIAQEVEQHLPKLVKDNDGPKSVKYSLLVPMLLQTVQELLDRVEALEAK